MAVEEPAFDLSSALEYIGAFLPNRPASTVSRPDPNHGIVLAMLEVLALSTRPAKILEIGTGTGEIAVALGVQCAMEYGGKITTIEVDRHKAAAAIQNIHAAGVEANIELLIGDANSIIDQLAGPFGLIIQNGAKNLYLPLLDRLIRLLPQGGILVSNDILQPIIPNAPNANAIDPYNHALELNPKLHSVWLPIGRGLALSTKI